MECKSRREFVSLASGAAVASTAALHVSWLPRLEASETKLPPGSVQFRPEIEPLVRLLEETPRDRVVDVTLDSIRNGTSYRELLAALFLAGIRNVQPRPAVGFKFHSVLVVHSAHQASVAAADHERWFPLLWGIDYFKSAQASDVAEGDWTMGAVDETRLPEAPQALALLNEAMEKWDVEAADVAAASAARVLSASQLLDSMAKHSARDFRSIGHKAIYTAGAFRLLGVIGWEHAEPVIRSLAYASLNHSGESNPATRDADADRAGRKNWELVKELPKNWLHGKRDAKASLQLLDTFRSASPMEASQATFKMLAEGIHPQALFDSMFLMAAELVSRQPAIVPLHAVTTTNAMHYLYQHVYDDSLRCWLLLQSASFLAHFRDAANLRQSLSSHRIDSLVSKEESEPTLDQIFGRIRKERDQGALDTFQYLQRGGPPEELIRKARELVFLKGRDSHDYKFSSAAIEDYYHITPEWRPYYLAGCSHLLHGSHEKTTPLAEKVLKTG